MTRIHVFDTGIDLGLSSINGLRNPTFLFVMEPIVTMFIFAILAGSGLKGLSQQQLTRHCSDPSRPEVFSRSFKDGQWALSCEQAETSISALKNILNRFL
ncbi:hypothetical protein GcM3_171012 [Golovinomyces cichoracearum]|uniref:Uncharacterized protein n=1 Tax=Golovinomyces cichoracearum TaxID=62708 RepID=A0A420HQV9_9PEZI|nr:hypothetical protein GcM3_171012 [Golovinomyces cichoracearum]